MQNKKVQFIARNTQGGMTYCTDMQGVRSCPSVFHPVTEHTPTVF